VSLVHLSCVFSRCHQGRSERVSPRSLSCRRKLLQAVVEVDVDAQMKMRKDIIDMTRGGRDRKQAWNDLKRVLQETLDEVKKKLKLEN
jgi:hypothetical protein